MGVELGKLWQNFYQQNIVTYIKDSLQSPYSLITLILDITIVLFLFY